jgi:hypothetical protein
VLLLIALLAMPWGLALSSVEGPSGAANGQARVRAKRVHPPKRLIRSIRWLTTTTPAFLEDDEESREEGDDADALPSPVFSLVSSFGDLSTSLSARLEPPSPGLAPEAIARLCRFRC